MAGQSLLIPSQALNANSSETLKPYEPGKATGSLDPTLPMPANKDKCGGMGKIIMAVVAVAVAAWAPQFLTQLGATGMFSANGTISALGGAIGGAAGSIASQAVGVAIGAQDKFSWKGVALSALAGGITGGLNANTQLFNLTSSPAVNTALRMATANALTQGIGVATGLQKKFDWKGVAASAAGGFAGAEVGARLPEGLDPFLGKIVTGFAAGTAAAVARGGRVAIQQVAVDAFGNAIGGAIAENMQPRQSMYSLAGSGARLSNWAEQSAPDSPFDDTYRQANLERMNLLARGSEPDGRTSARVQEDWLGDPNRPSSNAGTGSFIDAPTLVGRNAQGGYRWSSDFDSYPVASKAIQGTDLEPLSPVGLAQGPSQDYSLFSRASMNEYWSGDGILNRGMRAVGNTVYDVAGALTPADSTPQELLRARELGQLRQSFNAARINGDTAAMQILQTRHAQITSADGNPSMVQVSMASDILRAQTAQGLSADRSSLELAAGAAITQGVAGMVAPGIGRSGGAVASATNGAGNTSGWTVVSSDARKVLRDVEERTGMNISSSQRSRLVDEVRAVDHRVPVTEAQYRALQAEYRSTRSTMISEWEANTGQVWPSGAQAHHLIPTRYGGVNQWWNIHPAQGVVHQGGIHSVGSPTQRVFPTPVPK